MTWLLYALLSAALWGLCYVAHEQMLKTMSPSATMLFTSLGTMPVYIGVAIYRNKLSEGWQLVTAGGHESVLWILAVVTVACANLFMCFSIQQKNATLSGLVEISYPLFTALFAYLLFRERHLTPGTVLGAVLIFSGIACIYYFSEPSA